MRFGNLPPTIILSADLFLSLSLERGRHQRGVEMCIDQPGRSTRDRYATLLHPNSCAVEYA